MLGAGFGNKVDVLLKVEDNDKEEDDDTGVGSGDSRRIK